MMTWRVHEFGPPPVLGEARRQLRNLARRTHNDLRSRRSPAKLTLSAKKRSPFGDLDRGSLEVSTALADKLSGVSPMSAPFCCKQSLTSSDSRQIRGSGST